jgi:uncharacterized protein
MEENMAVLRVYPFLGIVQSLLLGEKASPLRCGAGWINYAVQTDGHVVPCPSMWGMKDYYVGHISSATPLGLKRIFVGEPCTKCDVSNICGGRCLYANIMKRWSMEAYGLVCNAVQDLVNAIVKELPIVRKLIEGGKIRTESFKFMRYDGCEMIL